MKACPNIDQVHFRFGYKSLSRVEMANFFASIRFNKLTWLTINLTEMFDGSNLNLVKYLCKIFV